MREEKWTYLGICDAGAHGKVGDNTSITTYDRRLDKYYWRLGEGGVVVDKRPCMEKDASACIHGIVSGPMLKMSLPLKSKDAWRGIEPCQDAKECGSLSYVSTDLYLSYWRVLGARLGKREGDTIVWEDGSKEQILPGE